MEIIPPYLRIYQQILKDLPIVSPNYLPSPLCPPYLPSYPPNLLCPRSVYIGYVHHGSIYQQILKDLENALPFLNVPKAKAGRKPPQTPLPSHCLSELSSFSSLPTIPSLLPSLSSVSSLCLHWLCPYSSHLYTLLHNQYKSPHLS